MNENFLFESIFSAIIQVASSTLKQLFQLLVSPVFLIVVAIAFIIFFLLAKEYKKTTYYKITKTPYIYMFPLFNKLNPGKYGEYLIYKNLSRYEKKDGRFLFNVYLPKEDGGTTEIDVLLICHECIFVFESKNYSGWIFGSENQRYWYQTLPSGKGRSRKKSFYNPIMQNRAHIKHLKNIIGEDIPIKSVIVFSNRCTLKNITLESNEAKVINREDIVPTVSRICKEFSENLLSRKKINNILDRLYLYTQVDDTVKSKHIENINAPQKKTTLYPNTSDRTLVSETPTCPHCGKKLVLRTAKSGANAGKQFYGCSGFPNCRYIKNI